MRSIRGIGVQQSTAGRMLVRTFIVGIAVVALSSVSLAQGIIRSGEPTIITPKQQSDIIDSITEALNGNYVFPETALKMQKHVAKLLKSGKYKSVDNLDDFCMQLTTDLREISHDKHLGVRAMPPEMAERMMNVDTLVQRENQKREIQEMKSNNYGFKEVKILPGNIGYVRLDGFMPAEFGGATAIATMNFLANTDAVIFDLRQNGGGSPSMIQLISSYFFEEPTHLNSFFLRPQDSIKQFWTSAFVEGEKMLEQPIYVLTSARTFSAAEEFSYNMKNLKRGTIVGDTTGGGAHPVDMHWFRIDDEVFVTMSLPNGRAINPITGTNWEGVGVIPDIAVETNEALDAAHLDAITKLEAKATDEEMIARLKWTRESLDAKLHPVALAEGAEKAYVGNYGPRKISLDNGTLKYQREQGPVYRLIPMGKDMFALEGLEWFRIKFERDMDGNVTRIVGLYDNGATDENERS